MLVAQLGAGAGDSLIAQAGARQQCHPAHHDALDEPSAQLSAPDIAHGDPASLFSFAVGPHGHPFHCHAGHRLFTAVTGSAGARLRFSTVSSGQLQQDPRAFLDALVQVDVPGDSLFTVRFAGGTWHQFVPADGHGHSALFALSCHPDETGGVLSAEQRELVAQGQATIASLTEVLPPAVEALLQHADLRSDAVPTVTLSLVDVPDSPWQRARAAIRRHCGRVRQLLARLPLRGSIATQVRLPTIEMLPQVPPTAVLPGHLPGPVHFQDAHRMQLDLRQLRADTPHGVLVDLLQAFIASPPRGVSSLMRLRNALVAPLGLRTSPLGCPVSSLLDPASPQLFAGRFPVLGQQRDTDGRGVQVVLGADDKHLRFRSTIGIRRMDDHRIVLTVATQVCCRNLFGWLYMAAIHTTHRRYVMPRMLQAAVPHLYTAAAAVPVGQWQPA
ncbi:DUF2867 domain-containing protein [Xanthomonas maliensis]|uniref:DUF2867 domain-containing protein n=1 Tax=Xanthomonas maliensis TaxID=1321368 RepID=UPI0009DC3B9C|nr:DUF2867 domain-containing protein [Xanthomonas maliensis]